MRTIVQTSIFSPERAFLWCGALSTVLHLGALGFLSLLPISETPKSTTSLVKVRLVETPAATPAEPAGNQEPPPMMTAKRSLAASAIHPLPQRVISKDFFSQLPQVATIAWVRSPPLQERSVPTLPHRVLQDHHAADVLTLKSLLKVAQSPETLSTQQSRRPRSLLSTDPLPIGSHSITAIRSQSRTNHHQAPTSFSSVQHPTIIAHPPAGPGASKSKVSLDRTIPPVYPRIARKSGWEGTVRIRVVVQPDGAPGSIQVRKSSGYDVLDDAAKKAVRAWTFIPAKDGNIPIRSIVEIPIHFDLRKQG